MATGVVNQAVEMVDIHLLRAEKSAGLYQTEDTILHTGRATCQVLIMLLSEISALRNAVEARIA